MSLTLFLSLVYIFHCMERTSFDSGQHLIAEFFKRKGKNFKRAF